MQPIKRLSTISFKLPRSRICKRESNQRRSCHAGQQFLNVGGDGPAFWAAQQKRNQGDGKNQRTTSLMDVIRTHVQPVSVHTR